MLESLWALFEQTYHVWFVDGEKQSIGLKLSSFLVLSQSGM